MKTSAVLAVSIVLVSILFCPMAMSAPPMPDDVQMVEPDPSLPKEIAGFWGKWEGGDRYGQYFVVIEKIDGEKASVYRCKSSNLSGGAPNGWERFEAKVIKENGKYKLWFRTSGGGSSGIVEYTLKGKYMDWFTSNPTLRSFRLTRVP
jgi:hypothetical protein